MHSRPCSPIPSLSSIPLSLSGVLYLSSPLPFALLALPLSLSRPPFHSLCPLLAPSSFLWKKNGFYFSLDNCHTSSESSDSSDSAGRSPPTSQVMDTPSDPSPPYAAWGLRTHATQLQRWEQEGRGFVSHCRILRGGWLGIHSQPRNHTDHPSKVGPSGL